jgi:hypothetical protein
MARGVKSESLSEALDGLLQILHLSLPPKANSKTTGEIT